MFGFLRRRSHRPVLIVSDQPDARSLDDEFLRHAKIRLLTTAADAQALEIARREQPRLIVEELEPPGEAGLALCRDLGRDRKTRRIPLIVVTTEELRGRAEAARADVVLAKPLAHDALFQAVGRFISLPSRRTRRISINLRFSFEYEGRQGQAFSRDLSPRGAFLKTDRPIPLGSRIPLRFYIPGVNSEVACAGIVRCTSSHSQGAIPGGIGVEFVEISEADRLRVLRFIDQQS